MVGGLLIILSFLKGKRIIRYETAQKIGILGCVLAAFPEKLSIGWSFAGVTTILLSTTTYYIFWTGEQIERLKLANLKQAEQQERNSKTEIKTRV